MSEERAGWKWWAVGRISVSGGAVEAEDSESEVASRTTWREGTRVWRIFAREETWRKVIRNFASALRRMAAWRRAYSSMRSARNGGYMGTGIPPASQMPAKQKKNSAPVGSMRATVSPAWRPRWVSSVAT